MEGLTGPSASSLAFPTQWAAQPFTGGRAWRASSSSCTCACVSARAWGSLAVTTSHAFFPHSEESLGHRCVCQECQSHGRSRLFATPWTTARQASLCITNSRSSLRLMPIESVMPSNYLFLCRPLLLPPSIFPNTGGFSSESALCIRWPKYWSFSFSISPSHEHPGLVSFRMDWLFLLDDLMFLVTFTVGFYSFGPRLTPQMTSGPQSTQLT